MLLIADDNIDTCEILLRLLKRDGYEAVAVASGPEALLFLQTNKPSLVILDHSMPGMDGLQVVEQMKRDPRLADVPIIMFTANDGPLRERALAAGVNAFVLKGSLDWSTLRSEIIRIAGPGNKSATSAEDASATKRQKRSG